MSDTIRIMTWNVHGTFSLNPDFDLEGVIRVLDRIDRIQREARSPGAKVSRPRWPMIVLCSPKGWTGPKVVDGDKIWARTICTGTDPRSGTPTAPRPR